MRTAVVFDSLKCGLRQKGASGDITMNDPQTQGEEDLQGLYDLAIPPGIPVSVIRELVENFEVDLVKRKAKVDIIGEMQTREILMLRGDLETVKAAEKYMFEALERKIQSWDRSDRYKDRYHPPEQKSKEKEGGQENQETVK